MTVYRARPHQDVGSEVMAQCTEQRGDPGGEHRGAAALTGRVRVMRINQHEIEVIWSETEWTR